MNNRSIVAMIDAPRTVTILIAALISVALWVATWSSMNSMDMGSMSMHQGEMTTSGATAGMMPAQSMARNEMGGMMAPDDWSFATIRQTTVMWVLMMAAMMLPSMAPIMAVYAGLAIKEDRGLRLVLRVSLFTAGYFLLWAIFSIAAALAQLAWRNSEWFTMGGTLAVPTAAGILMLIAGAYQLSPVKEFCLRHCRHPLTFLLSHWREGLSGAFPVGLRHGLYCFGCCVAFMGLMFVFGAMNIWWMAVIALYFLAEKIVPYAETWSRIAGFVLIGAGIATILFEIF